MTQQNFFNEEYHKQYEALVKTHESRILFDVNKRIDLLKQIRDCLKQNEDKIYTAMWEDMHKSRDQFLVTELSGVYHELDYFIGNLKSLVKPQYVPKTLLTLNSCQYTIAEPMGVTLIITPFNFPFNLSIVPVIGSIACGNPVMLKYSHSNPKLRDTVQKIFIDSKIPEDIIKIYQYENEEIFIQKTYNLIIFTGSTITGRIIYQNCVPNLTKCILELGGFNPQLVDESADLQNAAEQLVFGKFTNSAQICISPNYCCFTGSDESYEKFVSLLKKQMARYLGHYEHLSKIDNEEKFDYLVEMQSTGKLLTQVYENQQVDQISKEQQAQLLAECKKTLLYPPTLVEMNKDSKYLLKETFGPVLPLIKMKDMQEFEEFYHGSYRLQVKPLSSYLYTKKKEQIEHFKKFIPAGALSVNQNLLYFTAPLPFGGVGEAGFGCYHGFNSFREFSHIKPVTEVRYGKVGALFNKALMLIIAAPYKVKLPTPLITLTMQPIPKMVFYLIFVLILVLVIHLFMKFQ